VRNNSNFVPQRIDDSIILLKANVIHIAFHRSHAHFVDHKHAIDLPFAINLSIAVPIKLFLYLPSDALACICVQLRP
jgi:hypothetical protein